MSALLISFIPGFFSVTLDFHCDFQCHNFIVWVTVMVTKWTELLIFFFEGRNLQGRGGVKPLKPPPQPTTDSGPFHNELDFLCHVSQALVNLWIEMCFLGNYRPICPCHRICLQVQESWSISGLSNLRPTSRMAILCGLRSHIRFNNISLSYEILKPGSTVLRSVAELFHSSC